MLSTVNRQQNATTIRFDDDYTRQVIDTAAKLLNQTRTSFLLSVARERAEAITSAMRDYKNAKIAHRK
jgi:uncharacterized protein (DUF1778 family)